MDRSPFIAVLIFVLAACPTARAEFVLLGTGALLEGQVERNTDRIVLRGPGSEVILRPHEVLCVAGSPLEVYEWIRRERVTDFEGRLYLANWSIKNKLWPQAARELLDARQANPRDPRLAILERRLDELLARPPESTPSNGGGSSVAQASVVQAPAPVVQAAANKPLPHLPRGSLEHFTRKIQPLLRNGCATCHRGDEADPLGLDPQWVRGHASARSTQQNLRAVLEQIDLGSPEASYLLSAARGPHHGAMPFRGPRRNELIDRLEAWVLELAAANPPSAGSTAAHDTPSLPADSAVIQAGHDTPAANAPATETEPFQVPETRSAPTLQRGAILKRVGPRDDFDPAIFNERFRRPKDDGAVGN